MSARDDLIRCRFLQAEVEHIKELVDEVVERKTDLMQTDSVHGSDIEYPYIKRSIKVVGEDYDNEEVLRLNDEYQRLIGMLRRKKVESHRAYIRAMNYIYEASDPIVRTALYGKYIDGMTWPQIASKIQGVSPDAIRMACSAYLAGKDR